MSRIADEHHTAAVPMPDGVSIGDRAAPTQIKHGNERAHRRMRVAVGAVELATIGFEIAFLGVALGAGAGALVGALTDFGIRDQFMKDLASKVKPGDAVLFLLIKSMTADKVLHEIKDAGGTVLKTSLDEKKEQHLRDTLATAAQPKAA